MLSNLLTYVTSLSVIGDWFDNAGEVLQELAEYMGNLFNSIVSLVYDKTANEGAGEFTVVGIFLIAGFVLTSVWIAFRIIRNLVRMRG